jgi:hypothetical protein
MRKAWDKLGEIYNYSKTISVAEVDCSRFITETHEDGRIFSKESLCRRFDIKSYPTVYVFSGETGIAGKKYKGEQVRVRVSACVRFPACTRYAEASEPVLRRLG